MMEDRVVKLEGEVTDLKVANARLATSVEHFAKSVDALSLVVQTQRDTINQGRGVLVTLMFAAGAVGALVSTIVKRLFGVV
jgi:uncharacterized protein YlxW (UPF0749 family)